MMSFVKVDDKNENKKKSKPILAKIGIAILPIESYSANIEAKIIDLTTKLQNHQLFNLLDREFIEKVKFENQILHSSELNKDEAFLLGKILQADIIILLSTIEGEKELFSLKAIHTKLGIILFNKKYKVDEVSNIVADLENQIPIIKVKEKLEESKQFHLGLIGFGITRENKKMLEIKENFEYSLTTELNKIDHFFIKELVNLNNIRDESLLIKNEFINSKLDNFLYGNIIILDEKLILELKIFDKDMQIISKEFPLKMTNNEATVLEVANYLSATMSTEKKDLFTNSEKQADKIFELGKMYENKNNTSLAVDFYLATFHIKPTHMGAVYQYILLLDKKIERELISYSEEVIEPLQIAYELEILKLQYYIVLIKKKANYPLLNMNINEKLSFKYYLQCPKKVRDKYDQARIQLIECGCAEKDFYKYLLYYDHVFFMKVLPKLIKITKNATIGKRAYWFKDFLKTLYPKYNHQLKDLYENLEIQNDPLFNAILCAHLTSNEFRGEIPLSTDRIIFYSDLFFKNIDEFVSNSKDTYFNSVSKNDACIELRSIVNELLSNQNKESIINFKNHCQNFLEKHKSLKFAFGSTTGYIFRKEIYYFYSLEGNRNDINFKIDKEALINKIKSQLLISIETNEDHNDYCDFITTDLIYTFTLTSIQEVLGKKFIQDIIEALQEKVITPSLKKRGSYWYNMVIYITETAKNSCDNEFATKIKEVNLKIFLDLFEVDKNSDELKKVIERLKKI